MSDPVFIEEEQPDTIVGVLVVQKWGERIGVQTRMSTAVQFARYMASRDPSEREAYPLLHTLGVTIIDLDHVQSVMINTGNHDAASRVLRSIEDSSS